MSQIKIPYSSSIEGAKEVLNLLGSVEFQNAIKIANAIQNKTEFEKFLKEKREGFFEKYKTVDEVRTKIASMEKTIRVQELMLQTLNNRNVKLGEFILKRSLEERVTTKDLLELTDEYKDLFQDVIKKISSDFIKDKLEYEEIDLAIKLLNEPPYEEYYDDCYNSF